MPRHLRDSEHETAEQLALADGHTDDARPSRTRGHWMWITLLALSAAAGCWWWWA